MVGKLRPAAGGRLRRAGRDFARDRGALEIRVAGNSGRLVQSSTQDLEAYNLYLQGRFHLNK
jgi:hypothetical protein